MATSNLQVSFCIELHRSLPSPIYTFKGVNLHFGGWNCLGGAFFERGAPQRGGGTVDAEKDYMHRKMSIGSHFQQHYIFLLICHRSEFTSEICILFCVLSMAQQNYISGSRGNYSSQKGQCNYISDRWANLVTRIAATSKTQIASDCNRNSKKIAATPKTPSETKSLDSGTASFVWFL